MADNLFTRIGKAITGAADDPEYAGGESLADLAAPEIFDLDDAQREADLREQVPAAFWLTSQAELDAAIETEIEKRQSIPTNTLGSSNIADFGGYVYDDLEREPLLRGDYRWRVFDQMVKDTSIIAAGVRLFLNLIGNAQWTVTPAEDQLANPQAQDIADACYDMLFDMTSSWSTVVRKTAMYRFTGFAILEKTAKKRDDGTIGLLDIENRPQRSIIKWGLDQSGTVTDVTQRLLTGSLEVVLPRSKIVYAVDDTLNDSPEGIGLFRHLAPVSDRMRQFLELELIGFETDLRGIPVGRAPLGELKEKVEEAGALGTPARTKAEAARTAMLKPIKDFIQKHVRNKKTGIMLPSDTFIANSDTGTQPTAVPKWMLELLTGDSTSFPDIALAITRMNEDMARILGVEHIMLGAGNAGSFALAQSKVGSFYLTLTATLKDLVEVFERDIVQFLADLNGWPPELIPSIAVSEISEMDVEVVTRALASLATAGAPLVITDPAVAEVYQRLGLTPPPADDPERMALDSTLNPNRNDPSNPTDPNKPVSGNPEDDVTKRRLIKSARGMARTARAMRKAA